MQAQVEAALLKTEPREVVVGRFVVMQRVGVGAMGSVFAGYDPELDRRVALKVLAPEPLNDEVSTQRLLEEARALARLNHPHVVTVYEAGRAEDEVFVAMELVEGVDLAQWCVQHPAQTAS